MEKTVVGGFNISTKNLFKEVFGENKTSYESFIFCEIMVN